MSRVPVELVTFPYPACNGRGPVDYGEPERWTRVGFERVRERGMESGERLYRVRELEVCSQEGPIANLFSGSPRNQAYLRKCST